MERLTFEGNFCDIAQCAEIPGGSFCEDGACSQKKVWERLKAYEDTGLEPEAVTAAKLALAGKSVAEITEFEGISIGRLKELAQADKEGRVLVLPCKVGDTVHFAAWFGTEPHIVKRVIEPYFCTVDARHMGSTADFSLMDFGKFVFHTREEAEQALERIVDNAAD